ncbi:DEAD/DEAH box helicase [Jeongeupia naejangsanensis]|uniref:DEAD/DEAH box helicase n=1 Tax=Jeongeupia naejangsanensis TaxID=613195 RepID=A0ABS2BJ36_9NEIS|nr:DEAD/DEAH box helicase [Jeongeupia naejangsanensis]MBM3115622.1 DEAD/DEAH box helicase [Jeongeupia naejangsanensis]
MNTQEQNISALDSIVEAVIDAPIEAPATDAASSDSFESLGLSIDLVRDLANNGLTAPTAIQAQAIPQILAGHDLLASAQTGTGKTAAFLLPAIHMLGMAPKHHSRGPRVLVLTPTRELAEQVAKVATQFTRRIPRCKVVSIVGGTPYPVQHKQLSQPVEVVVATPGRLMDLMNSGRIDFRRLELLVLDEADRMLDMGFIDDIETIVSQLPAERQTALFSATLSDTVQRFAAPMMKDPVRVELAPTGTPTANIAQAIHYADGYDHKLKLTAAMINGAGTTQSIVFTATKVDADSVADWLRMESIRADALHGDLPQRMRRKVLDKLRRGEIDVIVATDVAARGIDVAGIGLVLNFDLPKFAEDYVHRIGRTGRAGREGRAVSLVGKNDFHLLTKIRRRYEIEVETMAMEGLEANFNPANRGAPRGDSRGRPQGGRGGYGGNRDGGSFRREGGYGQRDRSFSSDRGERSFADRAPREDRPSFGDAPRQERSFGGERSFSKPQGERSYGDRNDRAPRRDFGGAPQERRSYGDRQDRAPRGEFGGAPRQERSYGDRQDRAPRGEFGGAPRQERSYGDRQDRAPRGEFGAPQERRSYGDRQDRAPRGEFGGAPRQERSHGDRSERQFSDRGFGGEKPVGKPRGERPAGKSFDRPRRPE